MLLGSNQKVFLILGSRFACEAFHLLHSESVACVPQSQLKVWIQFLESDLLLSHYIPHMWYPMMACYNRHPKFLMMIIIIIIYNNSLPHLFHKHGSRIFQTESKYLVLFIISKVYWRYECLPKQQLLAPIACSYTIGWNTPWSLKCCVWCSHSYSSRVLKSLVGEMSKRWPKRKFKMKATSNMNIHVSHCVTFGIVHNIDFRIVYNVSSKVLFRTHLLELFNTTSLLILYSSSCPIYHIN